MTPLLLDAQKTSVAKKIGGLRFVRCPGTMTPENS
jgi:hypothetical protein